MVNDRSNSWPDHFLPEVVRGAPSADALTSVCLALEAWRRDLQVCFRSGDLRRFSISDGNKEIDFSRSRPTSITTLRDAQQMAQKWRAHKHLEARGVPVPKAALVKVEETSHESLTRLGAELGYPLVLKPNKGSVGRGVILNILDSVQLWNAYDYLSRIKGYTRLLLQTYHKGHDYRVLVLDGKVIASCRRSPANITGDGRNTVGGLIREKNSDRLKNPFLSNGPIRVDREVRQCLKEQGLSLESVPAYEKDVYLRKVANASAGGDVIDTTHILPRDIDAAAVEAVQAMPNAVVAGVDILYDDSSSTNKFVIIELNAHPHIGVNMYPSVGTGRDVPRYFMDYFFPNNPRRNSPGDSQLRIALDQLRPPLYAGVVSRVVVASLPAHRFPYRRLVLFQAEMNISPITVRDQKSLMRIARAMSLSLQLSTDKEQLRLILGAESESRARVALDAVSELFSVHVKSTERWEGPLTMGAHIDHKLVREVHG